MSYFFISKQLLWELFFRISNSKTRKIKLNPSQEESVTLETGKVYLLTCSLLNSNNIESTIFALICTGEWNGKTGKIYPLLGKFSDTMSAALEANILVLRSGSWNSIELSML